MNINDNKAELLAEDIEAFHMAMDKAGISRTDASGEVYSMYGRALVLAGITGDGRGEAVACRTQAGCPDSDACRDAGQCIYSASDCATPPQQQQAAPVPDGWQPPSGMKVVDKGFRWVSEDMHHIPKLIIEFEPVPANSPCDAKGWKDRDAVAAMLSAAPKVG